MQRAGGRVIATITTWSTLPVKAAKRGVYTTGELMHLMGTDIGL